MYPRLHRLALAAAALSGAPAAAQVAVQPLAWHNTDGGNNFAAALDLRRASTGESILLVGAPGARPNSPSFDCGAGFVFRLEPASGRFVEEAVLDRCVPGDGGAGGPLQGEDVALLPPQAGAAGTGWLALVGGGFRGELWRRSPEGAWAHVARLLPPGLGPIEYGGRAVGLARTPDGAEHALVSDGDSVFAWRRAPRAPDSPAGWVLEAGFDAGPGAALAISGATTALWTGSDGAVRLAAGVYEGQGTAVTIVRRDPATGVWSEEARLHGRALLGGHVFGYGLAGARASGVGGRPPSDVVVVGAPYRAPPYDRAGLAFVYRRRADGGGLPGVPVGGGWVEEARLTPPTANESAFGVYIGLDGGTSDDTGGAGTPGPGGHTLALFSGGTATTGRFHVYASGGGASAWARSGTHLAYEEDGAGSNGGFVLIGPLLAFGSAYDNALGFEAGRAWAYTLPPGWLTDDEPGPADAAGDPLAVWPSPVAAGSRAAVQFTLATAGPVRLRLFDALGREVAVLADGEQAPGDHTVSVQTARLSPGVYLARLDAGGASATQRFVVVR